MSILGATIDYNELTGRNLGVISRHDQERIRDTKVGLLGAGGVGGMAALLIAQMGFGQLVLCDDDVFEPSNLNRQVLATVGVVGRRKAAVAQETLQEHNPLIDLRIRDSRLETEAEMVNWYRGIDCLLVAADNLDSVVLATRAGRTLGIPVLITCPFGWRCCVTTVMPDGPDYEESTGSPTRGIETLDEAARRATRLYQRRYLAASGGFTEAMEEQILNLDQPIVTLAPVVNMTACLAIAELVKLRLNVGDVFAFPHYITMDLRTGEPWSPSAVGRRMMDLFGDEVTGMKCTP